MQSKEYVERSERTDLTDEQYQEVIKKVDLKVIKFIHAMLGLVSEVGELADALKKYLVYGKELDLVNIREELGDIKWYEAILLRVYGFTDEEIAEVNIKKLYARYPDKFNESLALNRDLSKERKVLES